MRVLSRDIVLRWFSAPATQDRPEASDFSLARDNREAVSGHAAWVIAVGQRMAGITAKAFASRVPHR